MMTSSLNIRMPIVPMLVAGLFTLHFARVTRAGIIGVSATSSVNLADGPNSDSSHSAGAVVSTSAEGAGGIAAASASTFGTIGSTSMAAGQPDLSHGASSGASYLSGFKIVGDSSGISLPLSFNFTLSGTLEAATAFANPGCVAAATVHYDVQTSASRVAGAAQLVSQAGVIVSDAAGTFVTQPIVATISPTVVIGGKLVDLTDDALTSLGFSPIPNVPLPNVQTTATAALTTEIALAIFNKGLAQLSLPAGLTVNIGYDVQYSVQSSFSVPVSISSHGNDALSFSLGTSATADEGAAAESSYAHTLTLDSITLPAGFDLVNPSDLQVVFDSGLIVPVTRQVPAPTSALSFSIVFLLTAISKSLLCNRLTRGGC